MIIIAIIGTLVLLAVLLKSKLSVLTPRMVLLNQEPFRVLTSYYYENQELPLHVRKHLYNELNGRTFSELIFSASNGLSLSTGLPVSGRVTHASVDKVPEYILDSIRESVLTLRVLDTFCMNELIVFLMNLKDKYPNELTDIHLILAGSIDPEAIRA